MGNLFWTSAEQAIKDHRCGAQFRNPHHKKSYLSLQESLSQNSSTQSPHVFGDDQQFYLLSVRDNQICRFDKGQTTLCHTHLTDFNNQANHLVNKTLVTRVMSSEGSLP